MMEEGRAAALLCATGSKVGLKRGSWTAEEDMRLIAYINKYGYPNWRALPEQAGLLRCGKSCRLRWINYLRPGLKRGNFTAEENETIIKLHAALGNKWSRIAAFLPGRTDNEIKNVWNAHLKKRVAHTATTASAGEHKNGGTKSSKKKRLTCVNAVPLPSAASTTTATTNAADDQSNTNKEEEPAELHKFEIPLLDLGYDLDMILDAIPDTRYAPTTSPCSSAYRPCVGQHQLLDVPEIDIILPDLCGIMDGEGGAGAGAWNNAAPCHSNGTDASAGTADNEKEWWWLEDLDQELGL